ncbi:MAG: glutamate--tRNA ligase [Candidatus Daviesbacteria bacterium]|nr:glutamate--tRNA ligase [Candidatus Daviesbacteria bacterium]
MEVRVRIAPSPTGSPHIGTAWQALFDYVFAKKNNGKFILRLEDTDRVRFVPESEQEIYDTLKWLGFTWSEGPDIDGPFAPYKQSERLEIYKKYSQELLKKDLAYEDEGALRFKINKTGQTSYHDLVGNELDSRGGKDITIENSTQEDFVIIKSDGYPTYNFANVIDDHLMEISHVVRGNEYISSMPKYIQLYSAFGWTPPEFAHLPLLVGSDRSKLSKRHGAKGALEYKKEGYLKEAVINFLALLGWSHPQGKEIFSLEEMIEVFDFKNFNPASAFFDETKLEWMNGEYIRQMSDEELEKRLDEFLVDHPGKGKLGPIIPLVKERIKKLSDFVPLTDFFFEKPEYEKEIFIKILKNKEVDLKSILSEMLKEMENLPKPWTAEDFEKSFRGLGEKLGLSASEMFQLIRVAISGQTVTPPLFESIQILGEEETVKRIQAVVSLF